MKAYFCNNPIKVKKWEAIRRTPSGRSDRDDGQRKRNDFKRFPNDERFYLPKSQSNRTEMAELRGEQKKFISKNIFLLAGAKTPTHPYISNLDNLNKIFANISIDDSDDNDLGTYNLCGMFLMF